MTAEQRLKAARAFWQADEAADDQVQAVLLIAQQKKFRPKTVMALDEERKAKHLASLPSIPETMAARALIVYHLAAQRPMMGAFLDALGIAHEERRHPGRRRQARRGRSLRRRSSRSPASIRRPTSSLYLNTLLCQDPDTWGGLRSIVDEKGWA